MSLNVYTLFICELYVLGFLSIIMIFAWCGSQYDRVLGFTCVSLIATLVAVFLSSLRSYGLQFLPIAVGNIVMMLAYGSLLSAFCAFCNRRIGYNWLAGALLWAALCLFPSFYLSLPKRVIVTCLLCIIYTAALIRLQAGSYTGLRATWWPAQLLLWIHLLFHIARIFLDDAVPSPLHGAIGGSRFSVYVILESILFVIGLTFTILAMVNERTQIKHKQASLLDPLTGAWNRRALFEQADKLILRCNRSGEPLTVILFDLDYFKSINDRYGHFQGDCVLIDFCRVMNEKLPSGSHFARLGGEEFAAVLIIDEQQAYALCEYIRLAVMLSSPENITYTVSIGVTTSSQREPHLANLMIAADKALYHAKAGGRNRVEAFVSTTENPASGAIIV